MLAVQWATDYPDAIGHILGFATHNDRLRAALVATGVELSDDAPVAVHVCPPHLYRPKPGKLNVVSTAWEAIEMPEAFKVLRYCDAICPTSSFLVEPFRKIAPGKPVRVVPLGVDGERFAYVNRHWRWQKAFRKRERKPLRFLWVGAPNARKGIQHVAEAWMPFSGRPDVELYIKTTLPPDSPNQVGISRPGGGNVIWDTRKVPLDELVRLYHDADCFVFPSAAEGFGLTLVEAMATGLPSLYTPWSGMLDLAPPERRLGFPLEFTTIERDWRDEYASVRVTVANPSVDDIALQMDAVTKNYPEACERGRRAAEWVRQQFTWERAGQKLRSIIDDVLNGTAKDGTHERSAA